MCDWALGITKSPAATTAGFGIRCATDGSGQNRVTGVQINSGFSGTLPVRV
jgi:hypothetical protein